MRIADEGEGFDPDEVPDPLSGDNLLRHSGRGIFLMKAFHGRPAGAAAGTGGHGSDFGEKGFKAKLGEMLQ